MDKNKRNINEKKGTPKKIGNVTSYAKKYCVKNANLMKRLS